MKQYEEVQIPENKIEVNGIMKITIQINRFISIYVVQVLCHKSFYSAPMRILFTLLVFLIPFCHGCLLNPPLTPVLFQSNFTFPLFPFSFDPQKNLFYIP